jgi:hypothetical protein
MRARDFKPNCQTTLRCCVSNVTEHDHFDSKLPSLCGILVSASSVVKLLWPMTADARDFRPNCQTTLRCFISDLTEHDHFDLKTPSFCGILLSASSAVKLRWSRTADHDETDISTRDFGRDCGPFPGCCLSYASLFCLVSLPDGVFGKDN